MKKLLSIVLAAASLSLLPGCAKSSPKPKEEGNHRLYIRSENERKSVTAHFFNSVSGESKDVDMKKEKGQDGAYVYSCMGDTEKFNMFYVDYDGKKSKEAAFNEYVSGWCISPYGFLPYTEGEAYEDKVSFATETLKFRGEDKEIYVWTPKDYDPNASEKYSTVYLFDGQWVMVRDFSSDMGSGCWNVAESTAAMMSQSANKAIVVGVSTPEISRYEELSPDLGEIATDEPGYDVRRGNEFASFVCETVVPYIRSHYHVYDDAAHTSITGSSLGGLEAFYTGMQYPEVFGTVGALSPSFWMYDKKTWKRFLDDKDFAASPFVYLYSGGPEDNGVYAKEMEQLLTEMSFPGDKLYYHCNPEGAHMIPYWRAVFPELLVAMFDSAKLLR